MHSDHLIAEAGNEPAAPPLIKNESSKTSYLQIIYGIIHKHLEDPNGASGAPRDAVVLFSLDDKGRLTRQVIYKKSGSSKVDAQAMEAVRSSAPFPPPPRDVPHAFFFTREGNKALQQAPNASPQPVQATTPRDVPGADKMGGSN